MLILEETELERRADNVFTEGLQFMVLEGENELRELDAMHMFASDACYVIKWEYRVERTGSFRLFYIQRNLMAINFTIFLQCLVIFSKKLK